MNSFRLSFLFSLLLFSTNAFSQHLKHDLSAPLELNQAGLNKVLCIGNGNTILFHFEPGKAIVVKVFDSTHAEIASQKHICRVLDINALNTATFKGLYDVNGEAVLFVEQEHLSKYNLVRVRFNSADGTIIEEKYVGESQTQSKRTRYYTMKSKTDDNYAIFFCTDIPQFLDCKLNVVYFNGRHETVKEVPLVVDRKKYDLVEFVGAEWQPEGICITLDLKKQQSNATTHWDNVSNGVEVYGHDLGVFYIPSNAVAARSKVVDVTTDIYPYYSLFTYNSFARSLNLLLLSYREYNFRFGTDIQPGAQKASLVFNLDEETMALKYNWIKNEKANVFYKQQTDSTRLFEGLPVKMFTNENGLSTVVYRSFDRVKDAETRERSVVYDSYLGHLCITQFDDEGNELWGTVLPGAQFFKSYQHFYFADELSRNWQDQGMFMDLPPQVYNRQFLSQNIYFYDKNCYIVYNDYENNFNNSMAHPGDTVYEFENSDACYYKMNRKREITKNYLFGEPGKGEHISAFIEGASFDEKRGIYAALVQDKKNGAIKLHMGWSHLE